MHNIRELVLTCKLGKLSILTELFIYLIPRRFLALSHSKMTCRYGKDSTPSPQTLVRSTSSAHPTLTLAPLPSPTLLPQTTPQTYPAPLRAWLPPKPLWLRVGPGRGGCADSGSLSDTPLLLAAAGFASSAAAAARLCSRAALAVMG